jgi:putative DNA primase/helicase
MGALSRGAEAREETCMTSPLDYVARGWPVFPCHWIERGRCTCKKERCNSPGKHPLTDHGFYDASTNRYLIEGWLDRWPNANWALRTGPESGFAVIDIDLRHGGYQSFDQFQQTRGPMPDTLRAITGGGGRHLFYTHPLGFKIPSVRGWMPGVDIKADRGYVMLPESRHISGAPYRWVNLDTMPATELPADVAKLILNAPKSARGGGLGGGLGSTADILNGVPEGERDDRLFRLACRIRRQTDSYRLTQLAVFDAAANCSPPFPMDQAQRKVDQAWAQDHSDSIVDWKSPHTADTAAGER